MKPAITVENLSKQFRLGRTHLRGYKTLREAGLSTQQLRDVGRIAAVVNAVAQVLAVERTEAQAPVAA